MTMRPSLTEPPPRRPARAATTWWRLVLPWGCVGAITVGAAHLALGVRDVVVLPQGLPHMTFAKPTPLAQGLVALAASALWLFAIAISSRRVGRAGLAAAVGATVLVAFAAFDATRGALTAGLTEVGRTTTSRGTTFLLLRTRIIGMETMTAVVRGTGVWTDSWEVIGAPTNTSRGMAILEPTGCRPLDPALRMVEEVDGGVAVVGGDGAGHPLAFASFTPDGRGRWPHEFVLFGEDDVGNDEELRRWATALAVPHLTRDLRETLPWYPALNGGVYARERALSHPSRWVRDAAETLLRAEPELSESSLARILEQRRE